MFVFEKKSRQDIAREAFVEVERLIREAHSKGARPDPRRISHTIEAAMSNRAAGSAMVLSFMVDFLISSYEGAVPDASTLRPPK